MSMGIEDKARQLTLLYPATCNFIGCSTHLSSEGRRIPNKEKTMKFRLALLSCALAVMVYAADATGKWSFETQGRNGPTTQTLSLKQDGGSLTGTLAGGRGGETQITDGKVDGDHVSFNVVREFRGNQMTIKYTGVISGDEMKLTIDTGRGPQEVTAKRSST
jgi:hypothetical protein